jgi:aryl-alcohol dehydrogenase-like predicted oxidoreductase
LAASGRDASGARTRDAPGRGQGTGGIMEYRQLGGSGLKVPVLTLGTGTFGGTTPFFEAWGTTGIDEARRLVDIAIDAGVTMFDSADIYSRGTAETVLGKAIAGRRDAVLISTKGTFRFGDGPNDVGSSRAHLLRAVDGSLRRLGTDYIDLYQLHGFDAMTVDEVLHTSTTWCARGRSAALPSIFGWHLMKSLACSDRPVSRAMSPTRYCSSGASMNGS